LTPLFRVRLYAETAKHRQISDKEKLLDNPGY
jgi:hypothetical protein